MYYLIITYPGQPMQMLMHTKDRAVAADEENKQLLLDMGKRLLKENLIASYQLVQVVAPEENRFTIGEY